MLFKVCNFKTSFLLKAVKSIVQVIPCADEFQSVSIGDNPLFLTFHLIVRICP